MTETSKTEQQKTPCWPCIHWCHGGCEIERKGWPHAGPTCPAYSREPGCDDDD